MAQERAGELYAVLGAPRDASTQDLRRRFHEEARRLHPDKGGAEASHEAFQQLQEAWEVLGDAARRKEYDKSLDAEALSSERAARVDLDDVPYDEQKGCFEHTCRCGDKVVFTEDDLEKGFDEFECASCSTRIRVLFELQ